MIPSVEEMEAATSSDRIPSQAEMEMLLGGAKLPKAPKPKALCKYGPRMANGKCPPKPKKAKGTSSKPSSLSSVHIAGLGTGSQSPDSIVDSLGKIPDKLASEAVKAAAKEAVGRVVPKITPTSRERRRIISGATSVAKTAIGKVGGAGAAVGSAIAGSTVAAGAAVLLAGLASYYGTTYVLNKIAELRLANTPAERKYQAALAHKKARDDAQRQLGRALTKEELAYFSAKFKEEQSKIGA